MPRKTYVGVNNKAKNVPNKGYVGIANKAKKLLKGYIGDANGKAQLFWQPLESIFIVFRDGSFSPNNLSFPEELSGGKPNSELPNSVYNHSSGDYNNFEGFKNLLMQYVDNSYGRWNQILGNGNLHLWRHYLDDNKWTISGKDIKKVNENTDLRSYTNLIIPTTRMYIKANHGGYSVDLYIKVVAKGNSPFSITMYYVNNKGELKGYPSGSYIGNLTNEYKEYKVHLNAYGLFLSEPYIDYVNLDVSPNVAGNFECYVRSIEILNPVLIHCLMADEDRRSYKYVLFPIPVYPCETFVITYNNVEYKTEKLTGNDEVYFCWRSLVNTGSNFVDHVFEVFAVSKSPFTISAVGGDGTSPVYDTHTLYGVTVYSASTGKSVGTNFTNVSNLPNSPVAPVAPVNSTTKILSYMQNSIGQAFAIGYYKGGIIERTFKQGYGDVELCIKHAIQVFMEKMQTLVLPAAFESLFNKMMLNLPDIIQYLISQKNYHQTHNMCEVTISITPSVSWERIDVVVKFENSTFENGYVPIDETKKAYGEEYYTSSYNLGNPATQCTAYAQLRAWESNVTYGVYLSSDTTAQFSGCKVLYYDNMSYGQTTMKTYYVSEVSLTGEYIDNYAD